MSKASEFRELERLRFLARANEASALKHAKREAELAEREKWQGVVADKDAALAEQAAALAQQAALIAELRAKMGEDNG